VCVWGHVFTQKKTPGKVHSEWEWNIGQKRKGADARGKCLKNSCSSSLSLIENQGGNGLKTGTGFNARCRQILDDISEFFLNR